MKITFRAPPIDDVRSMVDPVFYEKLHRCYVELVDLSEFIKDAEKIEVKALLYSELSFRLMKLQCLYCVMISNSSEQYEQSVQAISEKFIECSIEYEKDFIEAIKKG